MFKHDIFAKHLFFISTLLALASFSFDHIEFLSFFFHALFLLPLFVSLNSRKESTFYSLIMALIAIVLCFNIYINGSGLKAIIQESVTNKVDYFCFISFLIFIVVSIIAIDRCKQIFNLIASKLQDDVRSFLNAIPDAMIAINLSGQIVWVNSYFESYFGYKGAKLIGKDISLIVSQSCREYCRSKIARFFSFSASHPMDKFELNIDDVNGKNIPVETVLSFYSSTKENLIFIAIRDLSEKKYSEQKLLEEKTKAERSNDAKNLFIANVSHDLRTPVVAILGFSDLALDPDQHPEEKLICIKTIKKNGSYLLKLLDDLRDLSMVDAGKLQINFETVCLAELLSDIIEFLKPIAAKKLLTLTLLYKNKIPEFIETDAIRLRQILINIVGNAVKYTHKGSILVTVEFEQSENNLDNKLKFSIIDTGIGIAEEDFERIFLPFCQLCPSYNSDEVGSGLGLSLSSHLAQKLNGELKIGYSEVGRGSCFVLTINLGKVAYSDFLEGQAISTHVL